MENPENTGTLAKTPVRHTGGCHCGAVRFEVVLGPVVGGGRCNCSICQKLAPTAHSVKPDALRLLAGDESLGAYEWGARVSTRYFCKHCGVYCFGKGNLPELGGHFASVNLNCLDEFDVEALEIVYWDGRHDNWAAGTRSEPWPLFPEREAAKSEPPAQASSLHAN
jgi:hypothetical protein